MDEGHFSSHLRHMRAVYRVKRDALLTAVEPMKDLGWRWTPNGGGMHLVVGHASASHVRAVAAESDLDLALLSSYRLRRRPSDGLFLRFGGLDLRDITTGARQLVAAAMRSAE